MRMQDAGTTASAVEWIGAHCGISHREIVQGKGFTVFDKVTPDRMDIAKTKGIGCWCRLCRVDPGFDPGDRPADGLEQIVVLDGFFQFHFVVGQTDNG